MIEFTVYGSVQPWHKPKCASFGGKARMYNDPKTRTWEDTVAGQALAHRPKELLDGPLAVTLTFYLPRPKSRPKKELWPDRKPDLDRLASAVLDALTNILWTEDSRVVRLVAEKCYGPVPKVEIMVAEI